MQVEVKESETVNQRRNARNRGSIRLPGYDYAQAGAFFVTICTYQRICLFGDVVKEAMIPNEVGQIAYDEWLRTEDIRPDIRLDSFQVMPNHFHAIVIVTEQFCEGAAVGAHSRAPFSRQPRSLGSLVSGFKSAATKRINQLRHTPGAPVWQRNYYERVIRSERELDATRQYIVENPAKWAEDAENPKNISRRG